MVVAFLATLVTMTWVLSYYLGASATMAERVMMSNGKMTGGEEGRVNSARYCSGGGTTAVWQCSVAVL
jgi:hypothetical protein